MSLLEEISHHLTASLKEAVMNVFWSGEIAKVSAQSPWRPKKLAHATSNPRARPLRLPPRK